MQTPHKLQGTLTNRAKEQNLPHMTLTHSNLRLPETLQTDKADTIPTQHCYPFTKGLFCSCSTSQVFPALIPICLIFRPHPWPAVAARGKVPVASQSAHTG